MSKSDARSIWVSTVILSQRTQAHILWWPTFSQSNKDCPSSALTSPCWVDGHWERATCTGAKALAGNGTSDSPLLDLKSWWSSLRVLWQATVCPRLLVCLGFIVLFLNPGKKESALLVTAFWHILGSPKVQTSPLSWASLANEKAYASAPGSSFSMAYHNISAWVPILPCFAACQLPNLPFTYWTDGVKFFVSPTVSTYSLTRLLPQDCVDFSILDLGNEVFCSSLQLKDYRDAFRTVQNSSSTCVDSNIVSLRTPWRLRLIPLDRRGDKKLPHT